MIGRMLAIVATLLLSAQAIAQTGQQGTNSAPGATSGPAAGSPTSMRSPQAGALETKHQRNAVRDQSQSVRSKTNHQAARHNNDETGATGSSSPTYAPPPR